MASASISLFPGLVNVPKYFAVTLDAISMLLVRLYDRIIVRRLNAANFSIHTLIGFLEQ